VPIPSSSTLNLFIADDVGVGKTVEAELIATGLLLRRRVRDVVVACPPSMLKQWQDELDSRFGWRFEILDRDYVERIRPKALSNCRRKPAGANPRRQ
jgi:SNF2 family DNA or RNA helicase